MADSSKLNQAVEMFPAGLELLFLKEQANVRSALHAFVLCVHGAIIRAGLRFRSKDPSQRGTEILPDGWASLVDQVAQGKVIFNYIDSSSNETYEFKMVEVSPNDTIVVTVHRQAGPGSASTAATSTSGSKQTSSASTFQIPAFVNLSAFQEHSSTEQPQQQRSITAIYTNPSELERKVWTELFEPVGLHVMGQPPVLGPYEDKTKKEEKTSEVSGRRPAPIIDYDEPFYPGSGRPRPVQPGGIGGPLGVPPVGGGGLGRSDLDPLGRFGAGMTADPRGFRNPRIMGPPTGIGPGQLPPGARFDPFGPPAPGALNPGTRPRPGNFGQIDPDHEQPPPGFDDMFM